MTHWKLSTTSVRWLVLGLALWAFWPGDSQAQCRAYGAANTYGEGDIMGHLDCDTSGNLRVTIGSAGGLGTKGNGGRHQGQAARRHMHPNLVRSARVQGAAQGAETVGLGHAANVGA